MKHAELRKKLQEFWNSQQLYWEITSSSEFVNSPARERATDFVPDGSSVVDLGSGTAANYAWLGSRCRYFGVDISVTALKNLLKPGLRGSCADLEDLPFGDGTFDAVISTFVLEHTVAPQRTLQEILRVVRPGGRIILLGPAWDFPFWYPNSLRTKAGSRWWRTKFAVKRWFGQFVGWSFGSLPFHIVDDPDAFHTEFIYDADAVYVVWTYEVVQFMKQLGCRLVHWEVDDQLLGTNPFVRALKRTLMLLPPYRRAGSTVLLVFER